MNLTELLKLDPDRHSVIAVVGAGGKTSLIFALTQELVKNETRVIVTTTTHMAYEPDCPFAENADAFQIRENLEKYSYTVAASFDPVTNAKSSVQKITGLPTQRFSELQKECDVLLIEADGANRRPVKTPEEWEPVIPDFADMVIGVIGLDCLGKPIEKTAHRPEKTTALLGKSIKDCITADDLVKIAVSSEGLRKNVEKRDYRVFLNKSDTLPDERIAAGICEKLAQYQILAAWGSLKRYKKTIEKECGIGINEGTGM